MPCVERASTAGRHRASPASSWAPTLIAYLLEERSSRHTPYTGVHSLNGDGPETTHETCSTDSHLAGLPTDLALRFLEALPETPCVVYCSGVMYQLSHTTD